MSSFVVLTGAYLNIKNAELTCCIECDFSQCCLSVTVDRFQSNACGPDYEVAVVGHDNNVFFKYFWYTHDTVE